MGSVLYIFLKKIISLVKLLTTCPQKEFLYLIKIVTLLDKSITWMLKERENILINKIAILMKECGPKI